MNLGKMTIAALAATTTATLTAAVPEVTGSTMTQDASRLVTMTYTLSAAPAVVTLDVQTNANTSAAADDPGWTSIGGAAVSNAKGDVWKRVETGSHTITWRPDLSWPDHKIADGGARAVVTAWALDNTPDYMVVDISESATSATPRKYYPTADSLPGGILGNPDYRTTSIVMRKIMAKDIEWTMGSTSAEEQRTAVREATHKVMLTNNYYIGVFELTQAQWSLIQTSRKFPSHFNNAADRAMRPVENVCYNEIRNNGGASTTENPDYNWPKDPNQNSFLGKLRTKTGLDFDLPSEAQWEFAARAGNGDTKWGDGSGIWNVDHDENLDLLGRCLYNGGKLWDGSSYVTPDKSVGATNGTAIVGSYAPNAWGLYDTAGNVYEWCLDWFDNNINEFGGKVNIDPEDRAKSLSGATGTFRVVRSGCYVNTSSYCRPAYRHYDYPSGQYNSFGLRLVCTAGLQ